MDREQLATLRRQVEDDYRLDLAAIERLQRRYLGVANSGSSNTQSHVSSSAPSNGASAGVYSAPSKWQEELDARLEPAVPVPSRSAPEDRQSDRQRDDLVESLRPMFNSGRPIGR